MEQKQQERPPFCEKDPSKKKIWRPIEPEELNEEIGEKSEQSSETKISFSASKSNQRNPSVEYTWPFNSFHTYCNLYKHIKTRKSNNQLVEFFLNDRKISLQKLNKKTLPASHLPNDRERFNPFLSNHFAPGEIFPFFLYNFIRNLLK